MNYFVGCPQFLGHAGLGQDPLVSINFPVGISLEDSLTAHLRCREGYFLVEILSASQSTQECDISWRVSILSHQSRGGIFKVYLSIESLRLVETLSPSAVFIFPSEEVGTLVKSIQFSS